MRACAIDTETTGTDTWKGARPFAVSMCWDDGRTEYFQWAVDPLTRRVKARYKDVKYIVAVLRDAAVEKVFHNAKFDLRMIFNLAKEVLGKAFRSLRDLLKGVMHDTTIAAHACWPGEYVTKVGLKPLSMIHLGIAADDEKSLRDAVVAARRVGKKNGWALGPDVGHDYWMPNAVDPTDRRCQIYCTRDASRTMLLWHYLRGLMPIYGVSHVYAEEMELWYVTYDIEEVGVRVDLDATAEEISSQKEELTKIEAWFEERYGKVNLRSPKDVPRILEKMGCELKYTDKGNVSTDKKTLLKYATKFRDRPEFAMLLRYRQIEKLIGTYFRNYMEMAVAEGSYYVLHANFKQCGTTTSRYSCSDPNLQNIPKVGDGLTLEEVYGSGKVLLRARVPFGPRPGCRWYLFDFSQIEARIFAERAVEETMLRAFAAGRDVYQELADEIKRRTGIDVPRQAAKSIFLGTLYGMYDNKLALVLGVEPHVAHQLLDAFHETFPKVRAYMEQKQLEFDYERGFMRNRFGQIVTPDADYKSVNYTIQSEAARLLKQAMIRMHRWLKAHGNGARLVLTVHDELVVEYPGVASLNWLRRAKAVFEDSGKYFKRVKTEADVCKAPRSWAEKVKVDLEGPSRKKAA